MASIVPMTDGTRLATPGEQQDRLLGVVQPLGKLVDVEQHRAHDVEEIARVRRPARGQPSWRIDCSMASQRRMLIANDLQAGMGGIHGGLRFFSESPRRGDPAASMPGPAASPG
jgi:hypothetical protein